MRGGGLEGRGNLIEDHVLDGGVEAEDEVGQDARVQPAEALLLHELNQNGQESPARHSCHLPRVRYLDGHGEKEVHGR